MQTEKVVQYLTEWLKNYVAKSNTNGFVIGISGGIDSAVTSALCAKTGLQLTCVEMPIHQADNQVGRAKNHIKWLQENFDNINTLTTDLTPVFDSLVTELPKVENEEDRSKVGS